MPPKRRASNAVESASTDNGVTPLVSEDSSRRLHSQRYETAKKRSNRVVKYFPDWDHSQLDVYRTWARSAPSGLSIPKIRPTQGIRSCAVDVWLVTGRLLGVSPNICDQLLSESSRKALIHGYTNYGDTVYTNLP